ncbi:hypothetical protein KDW69_21105 [Burkholderia ambifaria]|nr:hypothetical protein [Burkholderia ambifaria]
MRAIATPFTVATASGANVAAGAVVPTGGDRCAQPVASNIAIDAAAIAVRDWIPFVL